jgi:hypothetical protein
MSQSFHQTGGWIEVIAGVMFSGKSEELIRRVRRSIIARKRIQVFKSRLDERYSGIYTVSSHDGRTVEAVPADSSSQIAQQIDPMAHIIAIDEAQFLDPGVVPLVTSLAGRGPPSDHRGHRHRLPWRAFRVDAATDGHRGGRRQAPCDLRAVRRTGKQKPAADRGPACPV